MLVGIAVPASVGRGYVKYACVVAAVAAAISAAPVKAQPVAADLLPAYEVSTIIASMGMRPVGRPAWAHGRYVVAAIDRRGREVNVVLDARDGQVLAVRPLGRDSFGPPPPGYGPRPAPYGPMDGRAPPPDAGPGGPPPMDEEQFYDNDQQQGSLPHRAPARAAMPPRDLSVTGGVPRAAPAQRKDVAKDQTPMPRPRPALAKVNDPSNKPADKPVPTAKPDEKAGASASAPKTEGNAAVKLEPDLTPATASQAAKPEQPKPDQTKADAANKPEAAKPDVRVIDLSKSKAAATPEAKPGEAIRF